MPRKLKLYPAAPINSPSLSLFLLLQFLASMKKEGCCWLPTHHEEEEKESLPSALIHGRGCDVFSASALKISLRPPFGMDII